jgi:hypothetical protein
MPIRSWAGLSSTERDDLVRRRYENEESPEALAHELGMPVGTMDRRLREWRAAKSPDSSAPKSKTKLLREEKDNSLILESSSPRIKSLDDLLEAASVDLSVWIVDHHIINKWEVGAKSVQKDLTYAKGKAEGTIYSDGELVIEPLFQVKAWLVRRVPIEVEPVVKPVSISVRLPKPQAQADVPLWRSLIIPDTHWGFVKGLYDGILEPMHDRLALDIAIQIAQAYAFRRIVHLGDALDMAEWSDKYMRSPEFYWTTQPAVIEGHWWLAQLRMAQPDAEMDMLEGNHDNRLIEHMVAHQIAAYGLRSATGIAKNPALSVPGLLGLDELGINYHGPYPKGEVYLTDDVRCVHGEIVRATPGASASAMVDNTQQTVIFGHIHRMELATRTIYEKDGYRSVRAFSPGCLCRIDGPVPAANERHQWQQGLGVIEHTEMGNHIIPIEIENGVAVFDGKVWVGRYRLDDLKRDTGWSQF